jgi:hypothetical protein
MAQAPPLAPPPCGVATREGVQVTPADDWRGEHLIRGVMIWDQSITADGAFT